LSTLLENDEVATPEFLIEAFEFLFTTGHSKPGCYRKKLAEVLRVIAAKVPDRDALRAIVAANCNVELEIVRQFVAAVIDGEAPEALAEVVDAFYRSCQAG